ncbi:MAG: fluoride efflux transporter CrcB [Clostridia bacterium]|nr:fluoride efflux transporter CrcB [Clostridia bacterium]
MQYFIVGIGGIMGSLTRYSLGKFISSKFKTGFPLGTFIINITGAFLLGIASSIPLAKNLVLLFADGFLGAYTTFSTFMFESYNLNKTSKLSLSLLYILSSVALGLIGYISGKTVTEWLIN